MDYRKVKIFRCLAGLCFLLALLFFTAKLNARNSLTFSMDSGFYDEEFYLEIIYKGSGTIYYTLDSSDPSEDSFVYTEPILITDASRNANVYSEITDVYFGYNVQLQNAGIVSSNGCEIPSNNIDKATVVRAVCIDSDGDASPVITGVYFVGYADKECYNGMNIISIVTNPDNLFDPEYGIYVLGNPFREYIQSLNSLSDFNMLWAGANYKKRGVEWERISRIDFWDSERTHLLGGDYGIRIQGGTTRSNITRSFNIFERNRGAF